MVNFGNMSIADLRLGATQVKAAYLGGQQIWGGEEPGPVADWLCFTAVSGYGTIRLNKNGSPDDISLEVSRDNAAWNDYTVGTGIEINASSSNKLYFRAKVEN